MKKLQPIAIALMLAATGMNVSAQAPKTHQPHKEIKMEQSNKQVAINAMNAFFKDYSVEGIKKYFAQDYIQHNPNVPTGIEPVSREVREIGQAGEDKISLQASWNKGLVSFTRILEFRTVLGYLWGFLAD